MQSSRTPKNPNANFKTTLQEFIQNSISLKKQNSISSTVPRKEILESIINKIFHITYNNITITITTDNYPLEHRGTIDTFLLELKNSNTKIDIVNIDFASATEYNSSADIAWLLENIPIGVKQVSLLLPSTNNYSNKQPQEMAIELSKIFNYTEKIIIGSVDLKQVTELSQQLKSKSTMEMKITSTENTSTDLAINCSTYNTRHSHTRTIEIETIYTITHNNKEPKYTPSTNLVRAPLTNLERLEIELGLDTNNPNQRC